MISCSEPRVLPATKTGSFPFRLYSFSFLPLKEGAACRSKRSYFAFPLISIFFFIVFYVLGMLGEKQAKAGVIDPLLGVWAANIILLPVGLFFLRQARNDARLFDADFYNVALDKFKGKFKREG